MSTRRMAFDTNDPRNRYAKRFGTANRDPVSGRLRDGEVNQAGKPMGHPEDSNQPMTQPHRWMLDDRNTPSPDFAAAFRRKSDPVTDSAVAGAVSTPLMPALGALASLGQSASRAAATAAPAVGAQSTGSNIIKASNTAPRANVGTSAAPMSERHPANWVRFAQPQGEVIAMDGFDTRGNEVSDRIIPGSTALQPSVATTGIVGYDPRMDSEMAGTIRTERGNTVGINPRYWTPEQKDAFARTGATPVGTSTFPSPSKLPSAAPVPAKVPTSPAPKPMPAANPAAVQQVSNPVKAVSPVTPKPASKSSPNDPAYAAGSTIRQTVGALPGKAASVAGKASESVLSPVGGFVGGLLGLNPGGGTPINPLPSTAVPGSPIVSGGNSGLGSSLNLLPWSNAPHPAYPPTTPALPKMPEDPLLVKRKNITPGAARPVTALTGKGTTALHKKSQSAF